ncbi:MAG: hypothetical protein HYR51_13640 [Candidatus Rokubacteria bacterium]|nr:hypothetical protein [Candidatus Rokubacteria bacterium]
MIGKPHEIAGKLRKRYGGVANGLEWGMPIRSPEDRDALEAAIAELHG